MPRHSCHKTLTRERLLGLLALCPLASPGFAVAAEYCVTCAGPAAMYACVVQGAPADAPPDPREQLTCIAELARAGGHESCAVPRSAPKPCPGVLKIVAAPQGEPPPGPPLAPEQDAAGAEEETGAEGETSVERGVGAAAQAPHQKPAKEPETVEELAKETVKSSKEGVVKAGEAVTGAAKKAGEKVEQAGSAVGRAAKKTWDCLVSLFSDC